MIPPKNVFVIRYDKELEQFVMTFPDGIEKRTGLNVKLLCKEAWANDADEIKHNYDLRLADPY